MFRGLWKLTWLEIKIFLRKPLGAIGSILFPVVVFVVVGRFMGGRLPGSLSAAGFIRVGLPVLAALLVSLSGVLSLVTIISIYREGGILKRLRATPLRPQTIITAHVLVKLSLTVASLEGNRVGVAIIPHTYENTILRDLKPGDPINIECDVIAKHVEKLLSVIEIPAAAQRKPKKPSSVTMERLIEEGF